MFRLRQLVSLFMAFGVSLLLTASPATAEDWRKKHPVLNFGVVSVENQGDAVTRYKDFGKYVERKLGVKLKLYLASDYAGVIQALTSGQLQVASLGASSYAAAWIDSKGGVEPIATNQELDGELGYYSVLFVKSGSPYKSLQDLKGKTVAFADPNSTSGYLVPLVSLKKEGINPSTYFGRAPFSGGHEQNVLGVLKGNYDAAFTWTSKGDRSGNFRMMVDKGMLDRKAVRVIWKSPLIPNPPMVIRKDLPEQMKKDVTKLFLDLNKNPKDKPVMEAVARGKTKGFVKVGADMYDPIVKARIALKESRKKRN